MTRARQRRKVLLASALALVLSLAVLGGGCGRAAKAPFWTRLQAEDLPGEVRQLLDWSLSLSAGQAKVAGGRTYLLITWGPRPEGAAVEIADVARAAEGSADIQVTVKYTEAAGSGETARPYDVGVVEFPAGEITWLVEGDPYGYVMRVLGEMRPIVSESRWIKLFGPAPGETVSSPFVLSGIASVFEGTVNFRLVAESGEVIIPVFYTMACMGDWGPFSEDLAFTLPQGVAVDPATGTVKANLEVFWISAENGDEVDKIVVPLQLRP